ncbi:MAG: hypothetical protein ACOCVR_02455 [Myxococcota bacterium]
MTRLNLSMLFIFGLCLSFGCGERAAKCSTTGDCDDGMVCEEGSCVEDAGCAGDEDCEEGWFCISGECVAREVGSACGADAPCPGELVCRDELPGGYCTSACDSQDDCPAGSVCVVQGGEGICLASCESGEQCREGYACSAGVCTLPCSADAECPGGHVCIDGACEGSGVGLPCGSDGECEDGLGCVGAGSGGYCTNGCADDGECPIGSICGDLFGEQVCLAACRDDVDCGEGLCHQGGCVPRCSESDCPEGFFCADSGLCRREGQADRIVLELGEIAEGSPASFEVPSGTHSITLMVKGETATTYQFTSIVDPLGNERITGTISMGMGDAGLTEPHRTMPRTQINTTQVPISDFTGMEMLEGTWSFTFSGGPAQASVVLKTGGEEEGSVPLNIFVATEAFPGTDASTLADLPHFQTVMEHWDHFFLDQAGVTRGELRFFDLPEEYNDIEIDMMSGEMGYEEMFQRFGRDDGLNVFLVRSISAGFFGNVAGISGGIPGPPRTSDVVHGGIVIEVQDDPSYTGLTFCHEAGHYHGLFHITEQNLFGGPQIHDIISDTPECTTDPCPEPMRHLMWPTLEPTMELISPESARIIRANAGVD